MRQKFDPHQMTLSQFLLFLVIGALFKTLFLLGIVFCLGTLLMMQLSGYPLLGPMLVFLGLTLMGAALWLMLVSLLRRKRGTV